MSAFPPSEPPEEQPEQSHDTPTEAEQLDNEQDSVGLPVDNSAAPVANEPPLTPEEDTEPFRVQSADAVLTLDGTTNIETQPDSDEAFETLTLAQALTMLRVAPYKTIHALVRIAQSDVESSAPAYAGAGTSMRVIPRMTPMPAARPSTTVLEFTEPEPVIESRLREIIQLGLRVIAVLFAWWGGLSFAASPSRSDQAGLAGGASYFVAAIAIWLMSEALPLVWRVPGAEKAKPQELSRQLALPLMGWEIVFRLIIALAGSVAVYVTWQETANNHISLNGFVSWIFSILAWTAVLTPTPVNSLGVWRRLRMRIKQWRPSWSLFALLLIMLLAAYFRLNDLAGTPPEMTSDHVEKLLDAQRVVNGQTQIFFANNGGREPMQMYLLALLTQFPGIDMNFMALKLMTVIEGLISIPLLYWMGREIMGKDERRLANLVGLVLAGLVAASYWHMSLSRFGLRIILTVSATALVMIYLSRGIRLNRREDFLKAGLALGFGLYMYQAVRMLPIVIVIGVGLAFLFRIRLPEQRTRYILNFLALVFIAVVVFVPMIHYVEEQPEEFLRRTSGRLFGDDVMQTTDEQGNLVSRNPTVQERLDAFNANLPTLLGNIRNAMLMFNWKGDIAWITGAPNEPAMDPLSGALLVVGAAAWVALMFRRREAVFWMIPAAFFIMLMPSALSIAYPIENPSFTRASGALPMAFLIAALPLALIARSLMRVIGGKLGGGVAFVLVAAVVGTSYVANAKTYFTDYHDTYLISSLPYSEAGRKLREFVENGGGYGNAFVVAYPYWWDHRAIGIESGVIDWPNGILSYDRVPEFLYLAQQRVGPYQFDPTKPIMFFYSVEDDAARAQLHAWFPDGITEEVTSYQPEDAYRIFRVPPLGVEGFAAWLAENYHPSQ